MSPTVHTTTTVPARCTTSDATVRHEHGVFKVRKSASSGGGRAWSEDEEAYLLRTRQQKTPYKHIANHLRKTELACRLHYHQLTHGSSRRKRTNSITSTSCSDSSSVSATTSPILPPMLSPALVAIDASTHIAKYAEDGRALQSATTCRKHTRVQLPSAASILGSPTQASLIKVPILPRPQQLVPMTALSAFYSPATEWEQRNMKYDSNQGYVNNSYTTASPYIDTYRLRAIYDTHRAAFWSLIASEYGESIPASHLEAFWSQHISVASMNTTPLTPSGSSIDESTSGEYQQQAQQERSRKATSISSLLGIDASPRSPEERATIRRMEEARDRDMMTTRGVVVA